MYQEKQYFRQLWVWAILAFAMTVTLIQSISANQYTGVYIMVGVIILFAVLRLEIRINEEGIAYRWLPFMITYRQMHWNEIESMRVRKYAPLSEFGGWGIRWSLQGTAHTVSGYDGLEIWVKNKKRFILLGTQHPEELTELIKVNQSKITV